MAESGKSSGKGNSQIPTSYSGKNAPIKKQSGDNSGAGKYGFNPKSRKKSK